MGEVRKFEGVLFLLNLFFGGGWEIMRKTGFFFFEGGRGERKIREKKQVGLR